MSSATDTSSGSSAKASPTASTKPNRLPAPALFVGPPSQSNPARSIHRTATDPNFRSSTRESAQQAGSKSGLSRPAFPDRGSQDGGARSRSKELKPTEPASLLPTATRPTDRDIDAKWREMQNTLDEVELTAQSTTHVFGATHAAALDDLREAQVALARAWGRGSKAHATDGGFVDEGHIAQFRGAESFASGTQPPGPARRARAGTETSASTNLSDESVLTESDEARSTKTGASRLEDETARDIRRAGERRAANEAYFDKVDASVKEVVEKLERVAEAMRGVEAETRSLWSERSGSVGMSEPEPSATTAG